ncbi:MAG: TolC family protein [Gammaproteobacteria bacterium]|jgi:outer membrane protein TolC
MAVVLSGCATYQPHPLDEEPSLVAGVNTLETEAPAPLKELAGRRAFNLADGLDLDEVAILAVLNNPDLKAQRARLPVAGAQVFAAGLLPDPQLGAGLDKPTGNTSGLVNAWALSLSYDIIPLITRQARIDAEAQAQRKVRLDLLWAEWQVIQQARSLAVDLALEKQRLVLLRDMLALYRERYEHSAAALAQRDITVDVNGTDLTALVDALSQINQLEQTHNRTRHSFNLLLGLQPGVEVDISPLPPDGPLPADTLDRQLATLFRRRPDLLALQAGYASQEERVRAAILAQFPSLGISLNRARDTSDVKTVGLGVTLTLPLFAGNRGNIAIERASREQLREEYRARLAQAVVDVDRLREQQDIIRQQQSRLETYVPRLKTLVERARKAYAQGDIDALTFLNMESTWVNKRLEQLSLVQAGWENRIALQALLALPEYPPASGMSARPSKDHSP